MNIIFIAASKPAIQPISAVYLIQSIGKSLQHVYEMKHLLQTFMHRAYVCIQLTFLITSIFTGYQDGFRRNQEAQGTS